MLDQSIVLKIDDLFQHVRLVMYVGHVTNPIVVVGVLTFLPDFKAAR